MEGIIKKERVIVHNKEEEGRKEESASLRIWGTTIHFISYRYSQFLWFPFDMILVCKWKRFSRRSSFQYLKWYHECDGVMTHEKSENKINYHSYTVIHLQQE